MHLPTRLTYSKPAFFVFGEVEKLTLQDPVTNSSASSGGGGFRGDGDGDDDSRPYGS